MSLSEKERQSGTALISVLLIFFIATYIVTEILERVDRSMRQTGHLIFQDQAYIYAVSAEQLAISILLQDLEEDRKNNSGQIIDHPGEFWANEVWFPLPGGGISAQLQDAQRLFNVNIFNVDKTFAGDLFREFINNSTQVQQTQSNQVNVFIDAQSLNNFIGAVVDWADNNDQPEPQGVEDYYYLGLETPYRAGNQPLVSLSELRLIREIGVENYPLLSPFLTALPQTAKMNINTLNELWIESIPGVNDASTIVVDRAEEGFANVSTAFAKQTKPQSIQQSLFSVSSEYFELDIDVTIEDRQIQLKSLIFRPEQPNANQAVRVIQRHNVHYYAPAAS